MGGTSEPDYPREDLYNHLVRNEWTLLFTPEGPLGTSGASYSHPREKGRNGKEIPNDDEYWNGLTFRNKSDQMIYTVSDNSPKSIRLNWIKSDGRPDIIGYSKSECRKNFKTDWNIVDEITTAAGEKRGRIVSSPKVMPSIVRGSVPTGKIVRGKEKKSLIASESMRGRILTD